MDIPRGRILSIQDGAVPRHAVVEVAAPLRCGRCAAGKGCGAGLIGGSDASRRVDALVAADLDLRVGDEVQLELSPDRLLQAAWLAYGLPLAGATAGAAFAWSAGAGDPGAAATALGGAALGIVLARQRLRRSGCLQSLTPTITARLASD
jgi:sigma-E factor negative regulatory protein RseC